MVVQTSIN